MSGHDERFDVIVIGGGPGGAAAATSLAQRGRKVLVLERSRFPRHHVGESMLLGVYGLVRMLGVHPELERRGFVHKLGSTHVWGRDFEPWNVYFNMGAPESTYAYQVERSLFDEVVLDHAESCGAVVRQGVGATGFRREGPDELVVTYESDEGERGEARAAYLVDASGQHRFLAQHESGLKSERDPYFQNMAVYRYYRGNDLLPGIDKYNVLLEAFPNGWFWYIPLHTGETSVGAVIGGDSLPQLRAEKPERFLDRQIELSTLVRRLLRPGSPSSGARVITNYSYSLNRFSSDRCLIVGDAACFTDPMFSSGVYLALLSGVEAAACFDYALDHPDRLQDVTSLYDRSYRRVYNNVNRIVQLIYESNELFSGEQFWIGRKIDDERRRVIAADLSLMRELHPSGRFRYERRVIGQSTPAPIIADTFAAVERRHNERMSLLVSQMDDLGAWMPRWADGWSQGPGLGYAYRDGAYRVVEGLTAERDGVRKFLDDAVSIATVQAANGRTSAREILERVSTAAPVPEQSRTRSLAMKQLMDGTLQELLDAEPVAV
jgi:halogenation protein CepH